MIAVIFTVALYVLGAISLWQGGVNETMLYFGVGYCVWKSAVAAQQSEYAAKYAKGAYEWAKSGRELQDETSKKTAGLESVIDSLQRSIKVKL